MGRHCKCVHVVVEEILPCLEVSHAGDWSLMDMDCNAWRSAGVLGESIKKRREASESGKAAWSR